MPGVTGNGHCVDRVGRCSICQRVPITSPNAPRPMRSPRVHSRGGADASDAALCASSDCARAVPASGGLRPGQ